jgi:glycine/D-amino acid oxidase-like deaminating enzyme
MQQYIRQAVQTDPYDIVVAGGGPAGTATAIAASRQGLKTLLLEGTGCAGGTSTAGGLPFWLGATTGSIPFPQMIKKGLRYSDLPRPRKAVGGIFEEAVNRIKEENGGIGPCKLAQTDKYPGLDRLGCHDEFTFDIEIGKRVLDEMLLEAKVDVLYYTTAIDVERKDDTVLGVYFINKSGLHYAPAKVVVDCTGDADLVYRGGFKTYKGDRETGEITHSSLVAHIEGIDASAIERYLNEGNDPWFKELCERARKENPELDLPSGLIIFPMVQEGVFMINGGTHFSGYDGTNGLSMTKLTLRGRQRAKLLVEQLFRKYIPGAQNCRLRLTASYPGVRETRRIVAEYILSEEDLLTGKRFPDTIALAGRHFDLGRKEGQVFAEAGLFVKGGVAPIPYRSLIPKNSENILAAGRCIAADGQALGPARIMSTCFAMGEAAGIAAAIKLAEGTAFSKIDVTLLQHELRKNGAIIDA